MNLNLSCIHVSSSRYVISIEVFVLKIFASTMMLCREQNSCTPVDRLVHPIYLSSLLYPMLENICCDFVVVVFLPFFSLIMLTCSLDRTFDFQELCKIYWITARREKSRKKSCRKLILLRSLTEFAIFAC